MLYILSHVSWIVRNQKWHMLSNYIWYAVFFLISHAIMPPKSAECA